jgi:hypothetical protein
MVVADVFCSFSAELFPPLCQIIFYWSYHFSHYAPDIATFTKSFDKADLLPDIAAILYSYHAA